MLNGNISNVIAPSVIIDGVSLFQKKGFRLLAKTELIDKIISIVRDINITLYIEKGKISLSHLEESPFPFSEVIEKDIRSMVWYLRRKKQFIFAEEERSRLFAGTAYLIDISSSEIIRLVRENR